MDVPDFQRVLAEGRALQARLADLSPVAVGGTAAAVHCGHRFSLDVDVVTVHLNARFEEVKANLAAWEGWRTNRLSPPVLILGEHGGVELGVRQLRRSVPLQITRVADLIVPTAAEMLRVKVFLLVERRAVRVNRLFGSIRCKIEKVFGWGKRRAGYRRVRYVGREPNRLELECKGAC